MTNLSLFTKEGNKLNGPESIKSVADAPCDFIGNGTLLITDSSTVQVVQVLDGDTDKTETKGSTRLAGLQVLRSFMLDGGNDEDIDIGDRFVGLSLVSRNFNLVLMDLPTGNLIHNYGIVSAFNNTPRFVVGDGNFVYIYYRNDTFGFEQASKIELISDSYNVIESVFLTKTHYDCCFDGRLYWFVDDTSVSAYTGYDTKNASIVTSWSHGLNDGRGIYTDGNSLGILHSV